MLPLLAMASKYCDSAGVLLSVCECGYMAIRCKSGEVIHPGRGTEDREPGDKRPRPSSPRRVTRYKAFKTGRGCKLIRFPKPGRYCPRCSSGSTSSSDGADGARAAAAAEREHELGLDI